MKTTTIGLATVLGFTALSGIAFADDGRGHRGQEFHEEIREMFLAGDYDTYVTYAEDNDMRVMDEERFGERSEHATQHAEAHEAVLDGDYDKWRLIIGDDRMTDIDQDNFYLLVNMAEARESGDEDDIDAAKEALEDAGVKRPGNNHKGHRPRGDRGDEGLGFGERFGVDRADVADMSDEEKQDLLNRIIEQIKNRLGLN